MPSEQLLRAMLLQAFYPVRSERQLTGRIGFDLLFRWFVGVGIGDQYGTIRASQRTATGCWKGRSPANSSSRCGTVTAAGQRLLSGEHFSVDGTLIRAWAPMKSFKPKQPPGTEDRRGGGRNAASGLRQEQRIKETFGGIKTVAGLRQTRLCGLPRVGWAFTFAAAADALVRLPKPIGAAS